MCFIFRPFLQIRDIRNDLFSDVNFLRHTFNKKRIVYS